MGLLMYVSVRVRVRAYMKSICIHERVSFANSLNIRIKFCVLLYKL